MRNAKRAQAELKEVGVSRLSVSLNAHYKATYNDVCKSRFEDAFEKVLEFIKCARDAGLDIEVTAVAIPKTRISKMEKIALEMKVKFRVRPYSPCIW